MKIAEIWPAAAGSFEGKNILQDPTTGQPAASAGRLILTPLLDGRFLRLDYTWVYQDKPQAGSMLLGAVDKGEKITAHWIDSWHMGNAVMALTGVKPDGSEGETLSLRGTYPAPPGPDWGWRIDLTREEGGIQMTMWNIWPEGKEDLAVEASYSA